MKAVELYLTYISQNLKILIKRQFHADIQDVKFHSTLRNILDKNPPKTKWYEVPSFI